MITRATLDSSDLAGAGRAAVDDHHDHDLCIECILLYHRHALGAEGVRGF